MQAKVFEKLETLAQRNYQKRGKGDTHTTVKTTWIWEMLDPLLSNPAAADDEVQSSSRSAHDSDSLINVQTSFIHPLQEDNRENEQG